MPNCLLLLFLHPESFSSDAAKVWRDVNYGLEVAILGLQFLFDLTEVATDNCLSLVSAIPGTAAACTLPFTIILNVMSVGIFIAQKVSQVLL